MRKPRLRFRLVGVTMLACLLMVAAASGSASGANNSEQVIFSGVAFQNSTFPLDTPAGFWIWCESDSGNPYRSNCAGAMYFYALGITKHVFGTVTESEGIYTLAVHSADQSVNCELTNSLPVRHGPANQVIVNCSAPLGAATSLNAVVNVTGP